MVRYAPSVNIESGFFYFKCPQTNEDVQNFCEGLRTYHYGSLKAPLQPGHILVVTDHMRSYAVRRRPANFLRSYGKAWGMS
jgi:hypothetical protein